MRIAHITTVHHWSDGRIFGRQACSLARSGHEVYLLAPGEELSLEGGVEVVGLGSAPNRLVRALVLPWRAVRTLRGFDADIAVFHDPELMPWVVIESFRKHAPVLVYDAHEDYRTDVLGKEWIPQPLRRSVAWLVGRLEDLVARRAGRVFVATPSIQERFGPDRADLVLNRPRTSELPAIEVLSVAGEIKPRRSIELVYAGDIRVVRGIKTILEASQQLNDIDHGVLLYGRITPPTLETELEAMPGWRHTRFLGWQSHDEVQRAVMNADIGLLPLLPIGSYPTSHPNKLFEYLCAGIPVVMSDFTTWVELAEDVGARFEVFEPGDASSLAAAIRRVVADPQVEHRLQRAVRAREAFSWEAQEAPYVRLVEGLAAGGG